MPIIEPCSVYVPGVKPNGSFRIILVTRSNLNLVWNSAGPASASAFERRESMILWRRVDEILVSERFWHGSGLDRVAAARAAQAVPSAVYSILGTVVQYHIVAKICSHGF